MINLRKILKPLMEYSYVELDKMSDDARKIRSKGLRAEYLGVDQGQHGHARTFWKVNSGSKAGKQYNCVVEIHVPVQGGLFGIANGKRDLKKFNNVLAKSDIKVHCSCPDFYWSGMKYNLGPVGKYKGALSPNQNAGYKGEPNVVGNNLKPDIRDPNREHVLCKHLLAVKTTFKTNTLRLIPDLKNFDNNIKINDELTRDLDEGKRVLGKDVELTEVSNQDAKDFIEPIIHAPAIEPDRKEEIEDNAEEIIDTESEPIEAEEPKEDNVVDIIDEESDNEPENPEDVEDLIEQKPDTSEVKSEEGAEDIIDDKNTSVKREDTPEEVEEKVILEKDKKKSDIPDPDVVLGA